MTEFKIYRKLDQVLEIVYALRGQHLQQGVDFDFTWIPEVNNYLFGSEVYPRHAVFKFYNDELAMMFALKYGS